MAVLDFIMEEALILIPALMIIGKIMKNTAPQLRRFIPITLLGVSIILTGLMLGFSYETFIQSILLAGAAVYGHQLYKQYNNGD